MKRYHPVQRKQFVSKFERSAISAVAFCRLHGFSTVSLAKWRKRYGACSRGGAPPEGAAAASTPAPDSLATGQWVPVVVGSDGPSSVSPSGYVLVAHHGRLEVPRGFDEREVGVLWQVIAQDGSRREVVS